MCLQLEIKATYLGVQTQTAYAFVNITVERNEYSPKFSRGDYRISILENYPLGKEILQIVAEDKDEHVCLLIFISD